MQRLYTHVAKHSMKGCNIGKTGYPFWFTQEFVPVNFIDNTYCSISAPGANNSFNIAVIKGILEIG